MAEKQLVQMKLFLSSVVVCLCALAVMMKMRMDSSSSSPASPHPPAFPQWMDQAASFTLQAMQIPCSGHGIVFENSPGDSTCECDPCFTAPDCSKPVPDCIVDADGGDPTFLEEFWKEHGAEAGVFIPSWFRLSYLAFPGGNTRLVTSSPLRFISQELENRIRELHNLVGNAVTKDRYLVLGTGSMQIVAAALSALSDSVPQKPASVVTRAPYYMIYKMQVQVLASTKFQWVGDAVKAAESGIDSSSVIELVASPNNPDTAVQEAVFKGTKARIIHDKAYYWPHFTPITEAIDEDVVLFSLSKCTGHAGSRIGWALVKDFEVYKKMMFYITVMTIGVSHDSQLRASKVIKTVIDSYKSQPPSSKQMFHFAHELMHSRWQKIVETFKGSSSFTLQETAPQHCNFFNKELSPSPAYAWIKCEKDQSCEPVFRAAGITGRPGGTFGVPDHFIRLCLIKRDVNFNQLLVRLKALVSASSGD